jgi:hypothetical protein
LNSCGNAPRSRFLATLKAVAWAFFGVRRRADQSLDASLFDPRAVIVAGLIGGLLFILAVVALVRIVVGVAG